MDAELSTLAGMVSGAIIQAMIADGWDHTRPQITRLFRQTGHAGQLDKLLEGDRAAVRRGTLSTEVADGRWQGRLESILQRDPGLEPDLRALVAELRRHTPAPQTTVNSMTATNNRGTSLQAAGNISGSGNRTSYGGIVVVIAVAVVLLIVGAGAVNTFILPAVQGSSSSISADTLCRDYLQAPRGEREQAVQRIAVDKKVSGAGSPFLIHNVDSQCGGQLDNTVGSIVAQQQY